MITEKMSYNYDLNFQIHLQTPAKLLHNKRPLLINHIVIFYINDMLKIPESCICYNTWK